MKGLLVVFLLVTTGFARGQSPSAEDSARCKFEPDAVMKRVLCHKPDKGPEFKGGANAFHDMMQTRFHYDRSLIPHEMTLVVQFVVEPDGSVSNPNPLRTPPDLPSGVLDEVMKFFKQMPKRSFQPAVCGNQPVACIARQPVILVP